jgi:predicted amidophosphoribosyltransferase
MADLHPMKIKGNWVTGYVLDWHVESSDFLGYDELGHAQYDTKRTKLGELVYKLKYRNDTTVIDDIVRIISQFTNFRSIDAIIPVPPSNISRKTQPVVEIAQRLGNNLKIQIFPDALRKTKNTPEVKNVSTPQEKYDILKGVFQVVEPSIKDKIVLVLDDLYRSGATLKAITDVLYKQGGVGKVKVLALTMTKRR